MRFDPNEPPPMPVSALLCCPTFMRVVHRHAPWLVYPIAHHARRDARQVVLWLQWAIVHYRACIHWLATHASHRFVVAP